MKTGRRWVVLDADYFTNDLTEQIAARFGWAGVGTWVALLCAAKKNYPQGEISYTTETEALSNLGIVGRPLVDDEGRPWTIDEFFAFTSRHQMTRNRRRSTQGRRRSMQIRRWDEWQQAATTIRNTVQKRRQRGRTSADSVQSMSEPAADNVHPEIEIENEIRTTAGAREAPPPGRAALNGQPENKCAPLKNEEATTEPDISSLKSSLGEVTGRVADLRHGDPIRRQQRGAGR